MKEIKISRLKKSMKKIRRYISDNDGRFCDIDFSGALVEELIDENKQLLETVERLKECSNCTHEGDGDCYSYPNLCYREPNKFSEEKKDYWEQR